MAEIYSDLPSPSIIPQIPKNHLINRIYSGEKIYGMRNGQFPLYGYQRRSVAAMIQKETHPVDIMDPLFIPITGIDGKVFYLQPSSMEILKECPVVQQNRGGVLCEEMGICRSCVTVVNAHVSNFRYREDCNDISLGPGDSGPIAFARGISLRYATSLNTSGIQVFPFSRLRRRTKTLFNTED